MRITTIDRKKPFETQTQAMNDNFTALYAENTRLAVDIASIKKAMDLMQRNISAMTRFFGSTQS